MSELRVSSWIELQEALFESSWQEGLARFLEELVEMMTWQQLGRHTKPVLLANIDGFWEPLIALLAHMRETEFIRPSLPLEVLKADRVEDVLPRLRSAAARAPKGAKEMAPELAQKL